MGVAAGSWYGGWCINLTDNVVIEEVTQDVGIPKQPVPSPYMVSKPPDVNLYEYKE